MTSADDHAGRNLWRPYSQMKTAAAPVRAVRTEGSRIHLDDGRVLIDGIASWWTACHGYNPPHIVAALQRQLTQMPHVMFGGLTHAPAETLAARLAKLTPGDLNHVFFSDSGSVAVEVAMKMAVQYWINKGLPNRTRFLAFRGGYHGDTLGAMSACDPDEGMHAHFGEFVPQQLFADLPTDERRAKAVENLLDQHREELAAVLIEPLVQGAGGMRMHSAETLATIARLTQERGHLLIADEIFTGFGRTGTMFASEQANVVPDIMCLSKALTGGVIGLAATVARTHVFDAFWSDDPLKALMHGPTFMANPLACAAANASLDLFEREPRLAQARALEQKLRDGLEPLRSVPGIHDVRALGAIGVVQFVTPPDREALRTRFVEHGVWIRPFGDVAYLAPALTISDDELQSLFSAMRAVLSA
ncbi:MAG: adenosylmethionine--8-amino-7-oxononanoate transaminase [Caulobacterales bacterium]